VPLSQVETAGKVSNEVCTPMVAWEGLTTSVILLGCGEEFDFFFFKKLISHLLKYITFYGCYIGKDILILNL